MNKPIVAITIGDPAGIGPETCVETLSQEEVYGKMNPLLIGAKGTIERAMKLKECDFKLNVITEVKDAIFEYGTIDLLVTGEYDCDSIEYGKVQKLAGQMSVDFVLKAIELGNEGIVDVVGTAPIHKEAIKLVGIKEEGHTEIFENNTKSDFGLTMFHVRNLRVFFLSRHMSLRNACDHVTKERCVDYLEKINLIFESIGFENPKIALAALNPHASDNGLFGNEEALELIPAVEEAQEKGLNVVGPVPADSVFHLALQGHFDAILSLYHDQGHIACKTLDFERAITITWGLPFMRSSVDHGTAFDIAGKGIANYISLYESVMVAADYWDMKNNH